MGFALISARALAKEYPVELSRLELAYESSDGETYLPCQVADENPLAHDFRVKCGEQNGKALREYTVHLWVSEYTKSISPRMSLEILYWVTDWRDFRSPVSHSSTFWLHFDDPTNLQGMELSQGVDQDLASLRLKFR